MWERTGDSGKILVGTPQVPVEAADNRRMDNRARPPRNVIAFPGTEDDFADVADFLAASARLLDAVGMPASRAAQLIAAPRVESRQAGAA